MAKGSEISFDGKDYIINGKPLLYHLSKHEDVSASAHVPAFLGSGSLQHYVLKREPDLIAGATALYLCSHCGGYDGSPIGAKIEIMDNQVIWDDLGYYQDFEDETNPPVLFKKVKRYVFDYSEYMKFIDDSKIHETPYYA